MVVSISRAARYHTHVDSCTARRADSVDANLIFTQNLTARDTLLTSRCFSKILCVCGCFKLKCSRPNQTQFEILFMVGMFQGICYLRSVITTIFWWWSPPFPRNSNYFYTHQGSTGNEEENSDINHAVYCSLIRHIRVVQHHC